MDHIEMHEDWAELHSRSSPVFWGWSLIGVAWHQSPAFLSLARHSAKCNAIRLIVADFAICQVLCNLTICKTSLSSISCRQSADAVLEMMTGRYNLIHAYIYLIHLCEWGVRGSIRGKSNRGSSFTWMISYRILHQIFALMRRGIIDWLKSFRLIRTSW